MKNIMIYLKVILIVIVIVFTVTACNTEDNTPTHTHIWGKWAVAKEPTCTAGIGVRVCIICNVTDPNTSIPPEHKWGAWVVAAAPTCIKTGTGIRTCFICSELDPSNTIPSLGHNYPAWTASTCTVAGNSTRTCSTGCGQEDTRTTGYNAGHNYPAWTAPTCTVAGNSTRTCTRTDCGQEDTRTTGYAALGHNFRNGICTACYSIEMVQIPSGTFTMGSPTNEANRYSDETQRQVTISKGFYMGKFQVTQELYQTVTGVNPSNFSSNPATGEIQSRRPVERVTWYDAVEFCNKLSERESLTPTYTITDRFPTSGYPIASATVTVNWDANGYRLPTEAEWEYACRAGTTTAYNTGDTISDNTGWYYSNSNNRTHEVGLKPPNAWGLHDMHGNVWEWCWDWYGSYESGAQTDPRGAASGNYRVLRGGSWYDDAQDLRSAFRYSYDNPNGRNSSIGFRVVRP